MKKPRKKPYGSHRCSLFFFFSWKQVLLSTASKLTSVPGEKKLIYGINETEYNIKSEI